MKKKAYIATDNDGVYYATNKRELLKKYNDGKHSLHILDQSIIDQNSDHDISELLANLGSGYFDLYIEAN